MDDEPDGYCRIIDGSWHMCAKGDPGARAFVIVAEAPAAYRHTMHMEGGQSYFRLTNNGDPEEEFGVRGEDYSPEYSVTVTPLFERDR